ncbi:uncharacterized protein LOC119609944 isoform X1 [Lucilia sericata]|uniref:uncharacterized protein LOC119609944 isoform X1 n=2 Tax=Lucilia sericata TaxID=13632 RepID=UPI0018A85C5F|nr:uncharacterized protein LOC119609944 isoform X1 [Lucilia sericata]
MAAADKTCNMCDKLGLKPFTKENIYYYYIPLQGLVSYGALSVNVMNPALISKILTPKKDLTNVLLLGSIVGGAFYVYGRPALAEVPNSKRGLYATLGGGLWAMGSVLGWAIIKSVLPRDNAAVATIAGLATGAAIVKVTTDYFADTDKLAKKN